MKNTILNKVSSLAKKSLTLCPPPFAGKAVRGLCTILLLCASITSWATQYCDYPTGHQNNANFGDANGRILLTIKKGDGNNIIVSIKNNTANGNAKTGLNYLWVNAEGANGGTVRYGNGTHNEADVAEVSVVVPFGAARDSYQFNNIHWAYSGWDGEWAIDGLIVNASELCTVGSKSSPELSLNATAKTLEIDATAETFQIVPMKAEESGAVSYSSDAEGVATVSNTGLVTAVGPGTATITVSVAENEDFAADSKTLTVEVIDWTSIAWLANSNDSYKLHISPAMGGTQRIDGGNLYVAFPNAVIGDISIVPSGGDGAWRTFALSNFPSYRGQFTAVWEGNTYTFTIYRVFDGVNIAKGMPSYTGHAALPAQNANDGNKDSRWGSEGAKHYSKEGDLAEDWWSVDLGAFYEISSIKTLYETAAPKNYSFYTSPNNDSWIEIGSYNHTPNVGNTDANYNEYTYIPEKVARYVKIFAREAVQADFGYGFSIWEFEVYGQPAENVDVNAPVLVSAAVSGTPTTSEIKIAVSASDTEDGEISLYRVRESSLKMDRNFTAVDGKLTFGDLLDDTDYSFTITALDAIGNQSNAIVVNASTAQDPANPATMAPEPPARSADDVRAIYSDAYADILMHEFNPGPQWGSAAAVRRVKSGNNYLLYDMSSSDNITWGMNDGGVNAIVAKDGYHAVGTTGLDASGMEYLHVDIWSLVALTNINVKINDAVFTTITHAGGGWQSYDLEMTGSAVDFTNIGWIKLEGITSEVTRGKAAVDNYYFWKTSTGLRSVSATPNNAEYGSASVVVKSTGSAPEGGVVADGTEVTFSAVANDGYVFVNWSNDETRATFDAEVNSNMNLTANFRAQGTVYCNTELTANDHTIYLTVKRSNVNEYTMIVRSTEEMTNFGGTVFYRPENIQVKDIRNEGVLSDGNHTLTVTMSADGEPYFGTPLYVVFAGVGEVTFNQLLNVRPEYAVVCDEAVSVTSITLSQNSANLLVNKTLTLTPTYAPVYATDRALTWETSNSSVATVENGVVTAVAVGDATITAKLTSDNSIYATCNVHVVASLTEATWHGYIIANPTTEKNVLITYSVTRDVEQHLTFSLTTDKNMVGFVAFINIGGVPHELSGYNADLTATYTTTDTYEDNIPLNCMWDVRGAGYGRDFNFTYMVGSENKALKTLALSETQDNTSAINALDGKDDVIIALTRTFTKDNLYTLVLPFDVDAAQMADQLPGTMTKLDGVRKKANDDMYLNFVDVSSMEAGVAYLYTPSRDVTNPVFENVVVKKDLVSPSYEGDGYSATYTGIYDAIDVKANITGTDKYVLGSDQWLYNVSEMPQTMTMNAFRGYFTLNFGTNAAPGRRARVVFGDIDDNPMATELEELDNKQLPDKRIENGQLLIIRNGHTYNAQGQLLR